jgi:hypothetical protein
MVFATSFDDGLVELGFARFAIATRQGLYLFPYPFAA